MFATEMTATRGPDGKMQMGPIGVKAGMRCTLGRAGEPQEIAAPVLLLASKGGKYMNDVTINVDGGRWLVMSGIYDGIRMPEESYVA